MVDEHPFSEYYKELNSDLETLRNHLFSHLPTASDEVVEACGDLLSDKAKFLRPILVFMCCRLCDYQDPCRFTVAVIGEYIHMASLLHDDVVDRSPMRRGLPSCHQKWDNSTSVLVGDVIYAKACELIAQTSHLELLDLFARAIRMMSEGELLQRQLKYKIPTQERYLEVLGGKTGALLAACAASAGALSQSAERSSILWQYGYDLGIAYQLVDDVLDYQVAGGTLGKPALKDLSEGTVTLPLFFLHQNLDSKDRSKLEKILLKGESLMVAEAQWVREQIHKHHCCEQTLKEAQRYVNRARSLLHKHFPPSSTCDSMEALSQYILTRSY